MMIRSKTTHLNSVPNELMVAARVYDVSVLTRKKAPKMSVDVGVNESSIRAAFGPNPFPFPFPFPSLPCDRAASRKAPPKRPQGTGASLTHSPTRSLALACP